MARSQVELADRKCRPCEGGTPPMSEKEVQAMLEKVEGWKLKDNKIRKGHRFKDFGESMRFANTVADLAEDQGHHPEINISWSKATVTLTTHVIGGLSENDFILAAEIDRI